MDRRMNGQTQTFGTIWKNGCEQYLKTSPDFETHILVTMPPIHAGLICTIIHSFLITPMNLRLNLCQCKWWATSETGRKKVPNKIHFEQVMTQKEDENERGCFPVLYKEKSLGHRICWLIEDCCSTTNAELIVLLLLSSCHLYFQVHVIQSHML